MTGRIAVGIDGSPQSGNALEWTLARARLGGEQLELRADVEAEVVGVITRALDEARGTGAESPSVDHIAVEGRAADAILGQAGDAQLIVVGTHGKGLVRRVLLGSVSRQVLNDADRPVAVVDLLDS